MTDAKSKMLKLDSVEVQLDQVHIPHGNQQPFRLATVIFVQMLGALPLIAWLGGAISGWLLLPAFCLWLLLVAVSSTMESRMTVRPGLLSLEHLVAGRVWKKRNIPLQTIREVQILNADDVDISTGSLRLHLTDGESARVLPYFHSRDAAVVGLWLQELVQRQDNVELAESPIPDELQRLRGRDKATER